MPRMAFSIGLIDHYFFVPNMTSSCRFEGIHICVNLLVNIYWIIHRYFLGGRVKVLVFNATIRHVAVSFIGGGNRNSRKKPRTCRNLFSVLYYWLERSIQCLRWWCFYHILFFVERSHDFNFLLCFGRKQLFYIVIYIVQISA